MNFILRTPSSSTCSNIAQKFCNGKLSSFIVSVVALSCSTQSESKKNTMKFETVDLKSRTMATKHHRQVHNIPSRLLNNVYWFKFCFFLLNPKDMVVKKSLEHC